MRLRAERSARWLGVALAVAGAGCRDPIDAPSCGDGACDVLESCSACPSDCGACAPVCGDGICAPTETMSCAADCPTCTTGACACGDGTCAPGETCASCAVDCTCTCGDGACSAGETCASCGADCACACGDGACTAGEACGSCAADCACSCGDGACGGGETCLSCASDCACRCGDGLVTGMEECDPPGAGCTEGCLLDAGTPPLVSGAGLVIRDVSDDGAYLAYTDSTGTLFEVATAGGAPMQLAAGVARARYHGRFLVIHRGVDAAGKVAASTSIQSDRGTAPSPGGSQVVIDEVRASPDGEHLYLASKETIDPTLEDLSLDAQTIVIGAKHERVRFSPSSDRLVVATDEPDALGDLIGSVRSYPTAGGPPITLLGAGATLRFDVTPDGTRVVLGANENGRIADLTLVPILGGPSTLLAAGASDDGFRVLEDGTALVFARPDGSLFAIDLAGANLRMLAPAGVLDLIDQSASAVVCVTGVDAVTNLETLALARAAGGGLVSLGSLAIGEGFTPGGESYFFRDAVQVSGSGRLQVAEVASGLVRTLGASVIRVVRTDDRHVLFLDTSGILSEGDAILGTSRPVQAGVGSFDEVADGLGLPAGRVAYALPNGASAGIYVRAP